MATPCSQAIKKAYLFWVKIFGHLATVSVRANLHSLAIGCTITSASPTLFRFKDFGPSKNNIHHCAKNAAIIILRNVSVDIWENTHSYTNIDALSYLVQTPTIWCNLIIGTTYTMVNDGTDSTPSRGKRPSATAATTSEKTSKKQKKNIREKDHQLPKRRVLQNQRDQPRRRLVGAAQRRDRRLHRKSQTVSKRLLWNQQKRNSWTSGVKQQRRDNLNFSQGMKRKKREKQGNWSQRVVTY